MRLVATPSCRGVLSDKNYPCTFYSYGFFRSGQVKCSFVFLRIKLFFEHQNRQVYSHSFKEVKTHKSDSRSYIIIH